jgi:hypothetical protein
MRITVVGVLIIVGTIVLFAVIANELAANINKRGTGNDQPNANS